MLIKGATMLYLISFIIGAFTGVMLTCLVVSGKGK